ncbi:MAG TPA: alpha/beta hydrolase, partial [Anaerolineales bacterium]|nr:alpha/beta hydrolase [Anaerolineales bacterium]
PEDGRTIEVVFGILPATGERKGMFVTATGGPGSAGLSSADPYTSYFDPSIPEHFDIVFFDQRGIGQSGGLQCTEAAAVYYSAPWDATTPEGEAALIETARTFANDCAAEMGAPDLLPYLGTEQAVEDLEFFRQTMGDEQFWLYGESYGTQYAQTYAAAHPDRLAGLILDGTVDLTLTGLEYYDKQARAFNDVLEMTLQACNEDEYCAESMGGGDAFTVYDTLAARLQDAPLPFEFPLPSGGFASRTFAFSDLETTAAGMVYSEGDRMLFLRALAAYSRNEDLVPLARLLYYNLYLDPDTLTPILDPTYSDGMYYGVECQDYAYEGATPEEKAEIYLRAGDAVDEALPRFASIFYGDLPCAFWPNAREDPTRPAPLTAEGIPTLVLGSTADPATPTQNGIDVHSRLADGYLVTEIGGPHVIFGWGVSCVDDLVTAFLVDDVLPARETECEGIVADPFYPLAPLSAADFTDPLEALASFDNELYYLPEYYYWDYVTPTTVACPFGGTLSFSALEDGEAIVLVECAFSEGFAMTGGGTVIYEDGSFIMDVLVSGLAEGMLNYNRDADWNIHVTGSYGGETIDLSE